MHFERFYDDILAHASYLIGDEHSGLAAVVDPKRDIDVYLDAARARGLKIRHAILTRAHTGFVTGHIELRDRVGAEIIVSARSSAGFAARRASDGDVGSPGTELEFAL